HAMTFDPALPPEGIRHNIHPEMRFSAGPVPGMPLMTMRLVLDAQACRRESSGQLFRDDLAHAHATSLSSACPGKVGTGFPKRTCANSNNVERASFSFVKLAVAAFAPS